MLSESPRTPTPPAPQGSTGRPLCASVESTRQVFGRAAFCWGQAGPLCLLGLLLAGGWGWLSSLEKVLDDSGDSLGVEWEEGGARQR